LSVGAGLGEPNLFRGPVMIITGGKSHNSTKINEFETDMGFR